MESTAMLRHLAFFEELSRLDESDASWREVSAGLVVVRLVDAWLEHGASVVAADSWTIGSVLSAIDEIPVGRPARGILRSVADAMVAAGLPDVHAVSPRLMAYARSLDFDAKWPLAIDVYSTIVAHAEPLEDAETVIGAHLRLGFCLRQVGDVEESATAYQRAGQIAECVGDMMGVLRSRIGHAKIALIRGNLPQAESILDGTIADAAHHGLSSVKSMALHDRSAAAGLRGDYELAVKLAYRAIECAETERDRDRILYDIAISFNRLGVRSAARDALHVLAATALEQYTRWAATIQLLAIAADDGMTTVFERYRRELVGQALPPSLTAEFEYQTGRGYRLFGESEAAITWLERAVETAREHDFNQLLFELESELHAVHTTPRTAWSTELEQPSIDVQEIADAIHQMRKAVGAMS